MNNEYPLGYYCDDKYTPYTKRHAGSPIYFNDLQNYIGRKILMEISDESKTYYRLIRVKAFLEDYGNVYSQKEDEFVVIGKQSRIIAIDKDRKGKPRESDYLYIDELYINPQYSRYDCCGGYETLYEFIDKLDEDNK